jgi:hypothetical protein
MLAHNDAEQLVTNLLTGAGANTAIAVVSKSLVFKIDNGGVTNYAIGDSYTVAVTKNPPAAAAAVAGSQNIGAGTLTVPTVAGATLVGDVPAETWTFTCILAGGVGVARFKVVGDKSGRIDTPGTITTALLDGTNFTVTLQTIAANDQIVSALYILTAFNAIPTDKRDKITCYAGTIKCSDATDAGAILLTWRDRSAG